MEVENFNQKELISELKNCFLKKEIEELARSSKFIQRSTSRLTGESFLMMNVFDSTDGTERSLNDSCDWLLEHFQTDITKQSLDERYNTDAVRFIKSCFSRVLEMVNKGVLERDLELPFSKIQITDSTSFQIPPNLAIFYKGYKGNGGNAILKMHLNYNLLNGQIADLFLTDGVANDNLYKLGKFEEIEVNGLYMRDLGYYALKYFLKIDKEKGYFLSRAKTDAVYNKLGKDGEFHRIKIEDYLPEKGQTKELEEVYVGAKKTKIKVRLILQSVPEEVALQRLKKLEKKEANSKYKVSEKRKAMCYFNVYFTNAPADMLPASIVRLIYTLRWQIELMFKIWKSVFKIDKVKKMSIFRFECYIYSKLIAILLTLHIHNKFDQFFWEEEEIELSPMKAAKVVKKKLTGLMNALRTRGNRLSRWLDDIAKLLIKRAIKDVRKLKGQSPELTSWQIIKLLA